jgi:hypothetical protein
MLRDALAAALCPKPCKSITMSQRTLLPDGTEEVSGDRFLPLCGACPERGNKNAPIRHIEVVDDQRAIPPDDPRYLEPFDDTAVWWPEHPQAARPLVVAEAPGDDDFEEDPELQQAIIPVLRAEDPEPPTSAADDDLPIPPAWGPDHPNHPDFVESAQPRRRKRRLFERSDFGL